MSTRILLTVLVSAALGGCASMTGAPGSSGSGELMLGAMKFKPKKCPPKCEIGVVVETPPAPATNYLTLKDGEDSIIIIARRGTSKFTWTLEPRNPVHVGRFEFDTNGIDFGPGSGPQITCGYVGGNRSKFDCKIDTDNDGITAYKYTIRARPVGVGSGPVAPLDPWVISE